MCMTTCSSADDGEDKGASASSDALALQKEFEDMQKEEVCFDSLLFLHYSVETTGHFEGG